MGDATPAPERIQATERRILDRLRARGLLSPDGERKAEAVRRRDQLPLAEALIRSGALVRETLLPVLGEVYGVPHVDLDRTPGDRLILDVLPRDKAVRMQAIPLFVVEKQLTVAVADPGDLRKLDDMRSLTGKEVLPVVALRSDIEKHLPQYYGEERLPALESPAIEFEAAPVETPASREVALEAMADQPVVRMVNLILARALQERASDIHLEPQGNQVVVRYRVDGRLQSKSYGIPIAAHPALVSRIKVLAALDIAERRLPQDGRVRVRFEDRLVDVRVSTFPTIRDEKVVLRLLDKQRSDFRLDSIGMSADVLGSWRDVIRCHQGMLLVTGPTGSGKSSTLFATLRELQRPEVNVVTLEDPVEYELEGISQGQVNERAGFDFARGLRAILRQDPDVILVGEIRDAETAQIAVQAALTGHLVLASLHTNDAASAVTRLLDIGVPAYLLSSALLAVVAQRLIRRLCPDCTAEVEPTADEKQYLGPWIAEPGFPFLDGAGCSACFGTGYRGRTGVHEILTLTPKLRALVSQGVTSHALAEAVPGRQSLWANGVGKVRARVTSLRELARVVDRDEA